MRIDELLFPPDITAASAILNKSGYRSLGRPSRFGQVFHKDGDKSILKLFSLHDHAYPKFVDLCRRTDNPHFPRFSRSSIVIKGTPYCAVKTELLTEGNYKLVYIAEFFQAFVHDFETRFKVYQTGCEDYLQGDPTMAAAFQLLKNTFGHDPTIKFDLHYGNMMMRGETVVISDPVAPNDA